MTTTDDRAVDSSSTWLGNAGSLVIGRLIVAVLGWIGTIIVARNLDTEEFGQFVFVFGLLGMMTIVTDLGLGRVALSGVMADREDRDRFAGTYVVLRSLLGLVGYVVAVLFTMVAGYSSEIVSATAVGGVVVIIATASHAYEIILQARLRLGVVAVASVVGRVAQLGLIAAAVVADGRLIVLILPAIAAEVVIAAIKVPRALRLQPMRYSVQPGLWWWLLKEAVPISLGTALATLYFRVDSIMLSKLADFTAVAVYGIAFKFVDLLHFLTLSVATPLLTVLVLAWPNRTRRFRMIVEQVSGLLAVWAGALVVGFWLAAEEVVVLLYGSQYIDADAGTATVVQLLVAGEIIAVASMVGLTVLTATGRHGPYPYIALAGLATNIGLNLWAIPRWGIIGAGVTTVATEVVVVVGMWRLVRRVPGLDLPPLRPLLRVVPAAAAGIAAGMAIDRIGPWPIAALGALMVYVGAVIAIGAYRPGTMLDIDDPLRDGPPPDDSDDGEDRPRSRPVVLVGHSRSASGAELVAVRYVDALLASGRTVRAVCPDGALADRLRDRGIEPVVIPELQLPQGPKPVAVVRLAARWIAAARILRHATADDDRLVVNGLLALPAVRLAGRAGAALWLVHDVVIRGDLRLVARASAKPLAAAAAVSQAAAAFPIALGIPTSVVRNGTSWPVDPAAPNAGQPLIVGINAKITPWKGHHVLFEAMADLPDLELEVLGGRFPKDAPYLHSLRERAANPDLAGRVRFLGHSDDPLEAMRPWSIAVSASVDPEAGPLAVLEAMSLGLPVVATAHGGAVEVLGDAGLLVEPDDIEEMRDALRRLSTDAELRRRCSAAGRAAISGWLTRESSDQRFLAAVDALDDRRLRR
ncbi:MAG: glycosyltransferase [Actinomycetota bacterium]